MLHVVAAYPGQGAYVRAVRSGTAAETAWTSLAIDPYWNQWAAGQFNEARTRQLMSRPAADLDGLEAAVAALSDSGVEEVVRSAFAPMASALTLPFDTAVCVYAIDPARETVRERQNGVLGSCIGDNILLEIDPRGQEWQRWVPYVMAHEYHHTVWGYRFFALKGGGPMNLLADLLVDGQADAFACSLYPDLSPEWTRALSPEQEAALWRELRPQLGSDDMQLCQRVKFGSREAGIPWCAGYTIGFHIVQGFREHHPEVTWEELCDMDPAAVLAGSEYGAGW